MSSYVGVPISLVASGGTPIAIVGDPHYSGPFLIQIGNTELNNWWNANFHSPDYGYIANLNQVAQFNTPTAVTVGNKFVAVNNTQVSNPLSPDPTALTPPVLSVVYGNESTQTISTLLTDLQASQTTIKASGITTVYYSPLGAALQNGTGDPNFNTLIQTPDGIMFQTQRQGQFTMTVANFIANITPTVTAIRAAKSNVTLLMKVTPYNPTNTTQFMDVTQLVQVINALGNNFHPAAIQVDWAGSGNNTQSEALMKQLMTYYRP